jgi:hypothetical protein
MDRVNLSVKRVNQWTGRTDLVLPTASLMLAGTRSRGNLWRSLRRKVEFLSR